MKQNFFLTQVVLILILLVFQGSLTARASGFSQAQRNDKLIFAIDIIRHGDRTPCNDEITTKPYAWAEGLGQLTPLGMRQEYALGKKLRHRYVEKEHLLPAHYLAQTMYVRSTDIDRTLMSAESFLMGLYPPGQGPYINENFFQPALPNAYQPIHRLLHNVVRRSLFVVRRSWKFRALL